MKKENEGTCSCCGKGMHIIAVLVVIAIIALAFTAGSAMTPSKVIINSDGQNLNIKTLSVSGSVTKMVTPDKVDIVLSVETLNMSAQKSQSDNASVADAVRTALKAAGVAEADIKTTSYTVNEEYKWDKNTEANVSAGYRTTNQIQVTLTDTTMAGKVVDAAVSAGANRVSSISFGLSKEKELSVRQTALNEAATTARVKANSIASGLGVTIAGVQSISENSFYYTPNYANYDMAKATAGSAPVTTPITAGDVEVNATVSVVFELK